MCVCGVCVCVGGGGGVVAKLLECEKPYNTTFEQNSTYNPGR